MISCFVGRHGVKISPPAKFFFLLLIHCVVLPLLSNLLTSIPQGKTPTSQSQVNFLWESLAHHIIPSKKSVTTSTGEIEIKSFEIHGRKIPLSELRKTPTGKTRGLNAYKRTQQAEMNLISVPET